jgi:hypothetical protein
VHGEADQLVSYAAGRSAFERTPWPKALLRLPGHGHSEPFLSPASAAYRAVAGTTVDFLRYALYGDAAARQRLAGAAGSAGVLDNRL